MTKVHIDLLNTLMIDGVTILDKPYIKPVKSLDEIKDGAELVVVGPTNLGTVSIPNDEFAYIEVDGGELMHPEKDRYVFTESVVFVPRYSIKMKRTTLKRDFSSGLYLYKKAIDSGQVYRFED
jgi:hypothetical protein